MLIGIYLVINEKIAVEIRLPTPPKILTLTRYPQVFKKPIHISAKRI
ncbi:hypothetical protein ABIB40_001001 [Pedobacter sp. UYP30]